MDVLDLVVIADAGFHLLAPSGVLQSWSPDWVLLRRLAPLVGAQGPVPGAGVAAHRLIGVVVLAGATVYRDRPVYQRVIKPATLFMVAASLTVPPVLDALGL